MLKFKIYIVGFLLLLMANVSFSEKLEMCSPEYSDFTNKDGTGYYWDVLRAIFKDEGFELVPLIVSFKRCLLLLKDKQVDGTAALFKTKKRAEFLSYPKSRIHFTSYGLIYLKENSFEGFDNIKGRVGKIRGVEFSDWLPNNLDMEFLLNTRQAIKMLNAKRIMYYAEDIQDFQLTVHKMKGGKLDRYKIKVLDSSDLYSPFNGTARGKRLAVMFDKGLYKLFKSGELKAIAKRYGLKESVLVDFKGK